MYRNFWSLLLAALLIALPLTPTASARNAEAPAHACDKAEPKPVEVEVVAVRAAERDGRRMPGAGGNGFDDPLTQERVSDALEAIYNNDPISDDQSETIDAYTAYVDANLSQTAAAVRDALTAEMATLGIEAHELDTRNDELQTPTSHPDWPLFESEADSLYSSLPGAGGGARLIWGIAIGALVAIVACDLKIQACARDVTGAYEDCYEDRICPEGKCTDKACCESKLSDDWINCLTTCGLNGPDGDYPNCCVDAPAGG